MEVKIAKIIHAVQRWQDDSFHSDKSVHFYVLFFLCSQEYYRSFQNILGSFHLIKIGSSTVSCHMVYRCGKKVESRLLKNSM
ncbi:hypothetical protein FKM82_030387 [Ascaphus truei]